MVETLFAIIEYMSEERFPLEHVRAIQTITHLFNQSEESEREIFEFVEHLEEKYPSVPLLLYLSNIAQKEEKSNVNKNPAG